MKAKWIVVGLATLAFSAALADICLPLHRPFHRPAHRHVAHRALHRRRARVLAKLCPPITLSILPPELTPPPLDPFHLDVQEWDLVTEIETALPPDSTSPPFELDTSYYGWMIPPDVGAPDRDRVLRKCHPWSRCHKTVPEPSSVFLLLGGLVILAARRRRSARSITSGFMSCSRSLRPRSANAPSKRQSRA